VNARSRENLRDLGTILALVGFVAVVLVGLYASVGVWNECRAEHSFLYCQHLMSR
jgi:hypothetical protein